MFGLRNHQYWIFVNIKVSSLKIFYHMAAQRYSPIVLGRVLTNILVNKADQDMKYVDLLVYIHGPKKISVVCLVTSSLQNLKRESGKE